MAELGSHQLDAASIFTAASREDGKKVKPISVVGVGGRHIFPLDRDCDDHVYCMFEFPAQGFETDPNKKVVVTYSSINGNGFGGYGEVVMGTKGTLILEREAEYRSRSTREARFVALCDKLHLGVRWLGYHDAGVRGLESFRESLSALDCREFAVCEELRRSILAAADRERDAR